MQVSAKAPGFPGLRNGRVGLHRLGVPYIPSAVLCPHSFCAEKPGKGLGPQVSRSGLPLGSAELCDFWLSLPMCRRQVPSLSSAEAEPLGPVMGPEAEADVEVKPWGDKAQN